MATASNFFAHLALSLSEERIETILEKNGIRIERIVSLGHASPAGFWYDQDGDEFIVLLSGAARLRFEDGEIDLIPGSYLDISAHRKHRVEWTDPSQPTVWLAVHYGSQSE
jgi:cupin 2 domain-containing protein